MLKLFKNRKNKQQEFDIPSTHAVSVPLNDIPTYSKEVENGPSYPSINDFYNEPHDEEIIEMLQFDAYDKKSKTENTER